MFHFNGTRIPNFKSIEKIDYDEYWKARGFSINERLKEREEIMLAKIPAGSRVADIGSGNSRLPVALKEKGCEVYVGDVSKVVLEGYAKFGVESVRVDLLNPRSIELPPNLDYVIMSEVLEHLSNPEEALLSFKGKTKKLFLTVPNSAFFRFRLHLMFRGRFFTQWVYHPSEHLRYWSHIDFLDWLDALGLKVEFTEASNGFMSGRIPWLSKTFPNLLGHQICYLVSWK